MQVAPIQYAKLNQVKLTRDIVWYQGMLIAKARWKTEVLTAEVADTQQKRRNRQTGGVKIHPA